MCLPSTYTQLNIAIKWVEFLSHILISAQRPSIMTQDFCPVFIFTGTLYHPHEPILLPPIGNAFVLRCLDSFHVDCNDWRKCPR
jgi:hypothetical protein